MLEHNCKIRQQGEHPELTYPDMGQEKLQSVIGRLLRSRSERGLNRVRKPVCREHLNEVFQKRVL